MIEEINTTLHQSIIQHVAVSGDVIAVTTMKSVSVWHWDKIAARVTKVCMVTPFTEIVYLDNLILNSTCIFSKRNGEEANKSGTLSQR